MVAVAAPLPRPVIGHDLFNQSELSKITFAATRLTSLVIIGVLRSTYSSSDSSDEEDDPCRRFRLISISLRRSFFDFFSFSYLIKILIFI